MTRARPVLAALILVASPAAAEDGDEGSAGSELRAGLGFMTGELFFKGAQFPELGEDDVAIRTALTLVPQLRAGLTYLIDRSFGVDLSASVGYASISLPSARDEKGNVPSLRLYPWSFRGHMIYRWHTSGSPRALLVQGELGSSLMGYAVQENEVAQPVAKGEVASSGATGQSILLSTTVAGPSAGLSLVAPLGNRLRARIGAQAHLPLYVRESPESSGRPGGGLGWSALLGLDVRISGAFGLGLGLRHTALGVDFKEKGDRGATGRGVSDGRSEDSYTRVGLDLIYGL
jgi:hypothetical protein